MFLQLLFFHGLFVGLNLKISIGWLHWNESWNVLGCEWWCSYDTGKCFQLYSIIEWLEVVNQCKSRNRMGSNTIMNELSKMVGKEEAL